ncbi:helix-turn-helix domain-containing protein [Methylobacterium nonmethylotrophicum]|uniref:Helix-turn-helix domain-containing protein n=1 Tax=Methylobacterium nonmethylotrophicum TaxID=1141884 RepID=A0A4Z0NK69_9HYPH|nr:helix-turn-helix domain-containing protein [Methylobacterium nonmethylotrophicum]TGD96022.1 helix-turn-helix domain-containing protein [Methylobacterium nonmethylotrophicum]
MSDDEATARRETGLRFSTDATPSGQGGFEAYHDLYATVADAARLDGAFAVAVTAQRLDTLILFDRRLQGVAHVRSPRRVIRNGFDHFTAQLVLDGALAVDTPEGGRTVGPGEIALIDMSRPMETRAGRARVLTLSVPRAAIEATVTEPGRLHGAVLPQDRSRLLARFLASLRDDLHLYGPGDRQRLARATADLLGLALAGHAPEGADAVQMAAAAACRRRARQYIDAHPAATPEAVAAGIGVSRSVLYRAFAPSGGVARYIRARRLVRLRALLAQPDETARIADLAYRCGFTSESDCSRAFRAAHGVAPREYRRLSREERDAPARQSFAGWWNDLR